MNKVDNNKQKVTRSTKNLEDSENLDDSRLAKIVEARMNDELKPIAISLEDL